MMTSEEVAKLRANIEQVKKQFNYCFEAAEKDRQWTPLPECIEALESLLPAPPEPMWPEGMAEWEQEDRRTNIRIYSNGNTHIAIYHCSTGDPTPAQAYRLACWIRLAAEMDAAVGAFNGARFNDGFDSYKRAADKLKSLHAHFLADVARGEQSCAS